MPSPAAANTLGTLGAVCWSIQLIPQIILNYTRPSHTSGLQPSMMLLWASAGVPLGVYNIVSGFNVALRIQPQILTVLSLITWSQCCYYGDDDDGDGEMIAVSREKWSLRKCLAWFVAICLAMGAVEAALILGLLKRQGRTLNDFGSQVSTRPWPVILMAVLAAILLAAGVLRHYWDIYTHRTVRGISFVFVGIDAAGDLFSLVSIFFQQTLDVLGMAIYGTELILWIGVFACGGWFNLKPFLMGWRSSTEARYTAPEPAHDSNTQATTLEEDVIALHELPSSTSVFRTPSLDSKTRRMVVSRRRRSAEGQEPNS